VCDSDCEIDPLTATAADLASNVWPEPEMSEDSAESRIARAIGRRRWSGLLGLFRRRRWK